MTNDIRAEINRLQRTLAQQERLAATNNDAEKKSGIAVRRRFLSQLSTQDNTTFPPPSIFIAYSESGVTLFEMVKEKCQKLSLEIITGFDPEVRKHEVLLNGIMRGIERATLFLGIWKPDYDVTRKNIPDGPAAGPSVWMPVELGIAVAYKKPFRLLIHNSIHGDFYTKIWGGRPHFVFTDRSFINNLDECLEYLNSRYHQLHGSEPLDGFNAEI